MSRPARTASWGERIAGRLIRFIPESVAVSPERALINVGCILMGVSALLNHRQSGSLLTTWPYWLVIEWSLGIIAGGALVLATYPRYNRGALARSLERAGILLIILCCAFYGLDLLAVLNLRGLPTALIFLAIAAAKIARLIVSSAIQGQALSRAATDGEDRRRGAE